MSCLLIHTALVDEHVGLNDKRGVGAIKGDVWPELWLVTLITHAVIITATLQGFCRPTEPPRPPRPPRLVGKLRITVTDSAGS